jgi:recombination protein RecA
MAKGPKLLDFQDAVLARLTKIAPHSDEGGTWEVSRSNKEVLSSIRYVLTTGITPFDDIVGGMPFGRIVEVFGEESSGKTALALLTAARADTRHVCEVVRDGDGNITFRPLDPNEYEIVAFYVDNERSLDKDEKIIFEGKELDVGIGAADTIDYVFKMVEAVIDVCEERAQVSSKLVFGVIVVDTIASTTTRRELDAKWGAEDFPRLPAQLSKGFSKLVRRVNSNNVCMVCTNQVRMNYEAAQGRRPGTTPRSFLYRSLGGMALKFYASHRVFMRAVPTKYRLLPDAQFAAGMVVEFSTVKNRLRMPQRDARMVLLYDRKRGGFNELFSVLETLLYLGFIEAESKERGANFSLKFHSNGIVPTTFGGVRTETTLEEDDQKPLPKRGGSKKDPSFRFRAEWPAFYHEHKADVDLLWKAAIDYVFSTPGLDGISEDDSVGLSKLEELES